MEDDVHVVVCFEVVEAYVAGPVSLFAQIVGPVLLFL